jgi:competence protein ComEA
MQHVPAWARNKRWLVTVLCFALGTIIIVWTLVGARAQAAAGSEPTLEEPIDLMVEADLPNQASPTSQPDAPSTVIVYVSGAVRAPDVYELPSEARIKDLVLAAGGLTADADPERINLAERLKDSQHIHVPSQGEAANEAADSEDAADAPQSGTLNLNTAGAADLESLPGIGASLAERIIEYRTANGPFKSIEELRNVKGIGPALFDKIAPLVSVGP